MLRSKSLKVISFMLIIKNKNNFHRSSVHQDHNSEQQSTFDSQLHGRVIWT